MMITRTVREHVLRRLWSLLSDPDYPEVHRTEMVTDLVDNLPPMTVQQLVEMALGTLVDPALQHLRREKLARSVRTGVWKLEREATFDEVSVNINMRLQRAKGTAVNVAKEIREKIIDMPGLRADVADDLVALLQLVEEELGDG
jgi:hypothetical protein